MSKVSLGQAFGAMFDYPVGVDFNFSPVLSLLQMTKDIVVQFNGRMICLPGLTRFTTCNDAVEMVLYRANENINSFALYESACGIERRLPGTESILKIVRSWGVGKIKFSLVIRKVDDVKPNVPKVSYARRKLQKMKVDQAERKDLNATIMNLNTDSKKEMKAKVISTATADPKSKRNRGKIDLMKRFLKDVMTNQQKQNNCVSRSVLSLRTSDDDSNGQSIDNNFIAGDAAMISDPESAFGEGSDCSSVCDLERNILEHDMESETDSLDKSDSVHKVDNTMLKSEKIRKIFSGSDLMDSGPGSEDADMESFMKTVVYDADSDEGRGTSSSE